jgi:4-amino-4-deoxy-L-arabinose transferase-like glycosyltransferase
MDAPMLSPSLTRWLVAAAFALALLTSLRGRGVSDDEYPHLGEAKEMVATGDWLTPAVSLSSAHRVPPLRHASTAVCWLIFGESAWVARLPSALAAAGTLLLVAWIGRMLGNARIGLAAAGVLLSCLGFFAFARALTPEMMNVFWITAAIACFVRRAHGGGRWHEAGFFLAIGMGLLTDGWLGAIVPIPAVLGWNLGRSRSRRAPASLPWIPGVIVALAVPLVWITLFAPRGGDMLEHLKSSGIFSFFGGRKITPWRPWVDLPFVFAVGIFPWLLIAFGALLNWVALRKSAWRMSPTGWLLLGWAGPTLLILLAAGPRSFGDSLMVAPAFALWIAGHGNWRDADPTKPQHGLAGFWSTWWYRVSLLCALAFIVSPAIAITAASLTLPPFEKYDMAPWFGPALGALALGCSGAVYLWTRRAGRMSRNRWDAFEEAGGAALAVLAIGIYLLVGSQILLPN